MKRTLQLLMLAILLLPQIHSAEPLNGLERLSIFIDEQPYWKQTMLFPRWQDTYVIVFEQEMLA